MKTVLTAINAKYTHSSLALRYMQKYNADKDIILCEFSINDRITNIYSNLLTHNAQLYCFSCYIWNIEITLKVVEMLKKALPDSTVILGGPEAAYNYSEHLKLPFVDYIMLGEGEKTLGEIIESFDEISCVTGLAGKDFANTATQPLNLAEIPLPYTNEDLAELKDKIIYFETSRGCPFRCSYCLSSAQGQIRYFPMEYVKKGFDLFFENHVPLVKLIDRTFNSDKKRAKEIIRYIIEHSKNTRVHFEVAPHILDDELIMLLNSAPKDMFQLEMGIQSCNYDTLKSINRNVNLKTVAENIKKVSSAQNMHIHLDLIAGLPYEDFDSFKKSFNYVYSLSPNMLQLGFLKVLHGTDISKSNDIQYCSFPPYEVISTNWITAEEICILKDIDKAIDKFYNSQSFTRTLHKLYNGNAFELFFELSKILKNVNIKKADLYSLLYKHYGDTITTELTFDFIINNKDTKLPDFMKITKPDNFKNRIIELVNNKEFASRFNISNDLKYLRFEAVNNRIIMADYTNQSIYDITEIFFHSDAPVFQ